MKNSCKPCKRRVNVYVSKTVQVTGFVYTVYTETSFFSSIQEKNRGSFFY